MNLLIFKCILLLFIVYAPGCQTTRRMSREVFGFTNLVPKSIYTKYDFSKLSVLVFLDSKIDHQFVEYARNNSVRTYLTGKYPADKLGDDDFRKKWFKRISANLIFHRIDGLNLDFDAPIDRNDKRRDQLTDLVKYLKEKLSDQYAEFSFSVPWSPINKHDTATNGQDYDYVQIVNYVDYLLVKSFHVNSQIFVNTSEYDDEVCMAKSNQGFVEAAAGLLKWLSINSTDSSKKFTRDDILDYFANNINDYLDDELDLRNKIILVYPWFGLDYTCTARVERQRCLIQPIEYFDANCSDKIAREVKYSEIMRLMIDRKLEVFYDPHSRTTYLEFSDNTHVHQLWFDFYSDYALKYPYVIQFNLRGIGFYALDYLDYSTSDQSQNTKTMWDLIPFKK